MTEAVDRYHRQALLPEIGAHGMEKIAAASVTIIGCGALGTAMAEILVRAGVGRVRIADRDFVERSNLQRQVLFDESDADRKLPKAAAAEEKLKRINQSVMIQTDIVDVTPRNIEPLIEGQDMVLDGTDNAETRFLINDACVKQGIPWIYGGAVGTQGLVAPILPRKGPCLRCFLPEPPPPGTLPTGDTAGILAAAPLTVAALQTTAALKLILGDESGVGSLTRIDVWRPHMKSIEIARDDNCPACGRGKFEFLIAERTTWTTTLYGRNAVQVAPPDKNTINLESLATRLSKHLDTSFNGLLLTIYASPLEIVLFPDGRGIVKGTADEAAARAAYAKYVDW